MIKNFVNLENADLIPQFSRLAKEAGEAINDGEVARANGALRCLWAIEDVLRERGPNSRLELLPLLDDPSRLVRYYAAQHLLGLVPERAPRSSKRTRNYGSIRSAADARGTLRMLDSGEHKPD